ncbi:hypothetical protein [Chamaesiphon minutus]|nr:hypothetical protein [Chamaesiphon minutus]
MLDNCDRALTCHEWVFKAFTPLPDYLDLKLDTNVAIESSASDLLS